MKLAIAALLAGSAAAFAPMAPVVTRNSALGYSVKLISEEHGIDSTIECAGDTFIVGELVLRAIFELFVNRCCSCHQEDRG
jgi:hypothetical protein